MNRIRFEGLDYAPVADFGLLRAAHDAAVARRGAHDWDIAAAALILAECGIHFEDICAGPPAFDRESTQHGALLAVRSGDLRPVLHKALKAVYGCPSEEREEPAREHGIS